MPDRSKNQFTLLYVEDDSNDVFFLKRAFEKKCPGRNFLSVPTGEDAIQYLQGLPPYSDRDKHPIPRLLITDLKMPRVSGFDLLLWLRKHSAFRLLPALVLSSSRHPGDIQRAYSLGVNSYHVKPTDTQELFEVLANLIDYWDRSELPLVDSISAVRRPPEEL
jgi:CheY-like chemotaxis protein